MSPPRSPFLSSGQVGPGPVSRVRTPGVVWNLHPRSCVCLGHLDFSELNNGCQSVPPTNIGDRIGFNDPVALRAGISSLHLPRFLAPFFFEAVLLMLPPPLSPIGPSLSPIGPSLSPIGPSLSASFLRRGGPVFRVFLLLAFKMVFSFQGWMLVDSKHLVNLCSAGLSVRPRQVAVVSLHTPLLLKS